MKMTGTLIRCRHCERRIQWVDGVGWLHPDPRIYFVPWVEPQCEEAEPGTSIVVEVVPRHLA
jgi:hypothetical protein